MTLAPTYDYDYYDFYDFQTNYDFSSNYDINYITGVYCNESENILIAITISIAILIPTII